MERSSFKFRWSSILADLILFFKSGLIRLFRLSAIQFEYLAFASNAHDSIGSRFFEPFDTCRVQNFGTRIPDIQPTNGILLRKIRDLIVSFTVSFSLFTVSFARHFIPYPMGYSPIHPSFWDTSDSSAHYSSKIFRPLRGDGSFSLFSSIHYPLIPCL